MIKKCFFMLIMLSSFSSLASAYCTQTGNELPKLVGVDSSNRDLIYADLLSEANQCGCKLVRFPGVGEVDTSKILSVLLAAKLSNGTVRVDFKDAESCDSGSRVYLE